MEVFNLLNFLMRKVILSLFFCALNLVVLAQTEFKNLNYNDALAMAKAEDKMVFIDFYTDWCGPCKMLAPVLEDVQEEMKNVKIVKVDIDENPNVASEYKVKNIPTIKVFKNGEEVDTLMGFMPKDVLKSKVEAHL